MSNTTDMIAEYRRRLEVMEAFERGENIEFKVQLDWYPASTPTWYWEAHDFRVAPKLIEGWVNVYGDGKWGSRYESQDEAKRNAWTTSSRIVYMREVEQ